MEFVFGSHDATFAIQPLWNPTLAQIPREDGAPGDRSGTTGIRMLHKRSQSARSNRRQLAYGF